MSAAGPVRARRVRRPVRLLAELAAFEPRTTEMMGELRALGRGVTGLAPWRARLWEVRVDGRLLGALLVGRKAFDQWHGTVFLADAAAAAPLAAALDRGPARSVSGAERDVAPLRPLVPRAVGMTVLPWIVLEPPIAVAPDPDGTARLATSADLAALTDLYHGYELWGLTNAWQVRQALRQALRHGTVLVAERDGLLAGAAMFTSRTDRYLVLDGLTVPPEHRRSGVAWSVAAQAQAFANQHGLGATLALAATNPMPLAPLAGPERWGGMWMVPRHRFPGQGRLRSLYLGLHPRQVRAPVLVRDPTDPSQPAAF